MGFKEESLKRTQVWVAILAGIVTFIVGAYNVKNIFFPKKETILVVTAPPVSSPSPIRSAVEDIGASWIKKWGTPKDQTSTNSDLH